MQKKMKGECKVNCKQISRCDVICLRFKLLMLVRMCKFFSGKRLIYSCTVQEDPLTSIQIYFLTVHIFTSSAVFGIVHESFKLSN
jgi:hypothetical protein